MGLTIVCGVIMKNRSSDGLISVDPEVKVGEHRLFILESVCSQCVGTLDNNKDITCIETVEGAWFPTSFLRLVFPPVPSKIQVHAQWHPVLLRTDPELLKDGMA